jgi:uncharacterized membrane protein (DUF106 family)
MNKKYILIGVLVLIVLYIIYTAFVDQEKVFNKKIADKDVALNVEVKTEIKEQVKAESTKVIDTALYDMEMQMYNAQLSIYLDCRKNNGGSFGNPFACDAPRLPIKPI